MQYAHSLVRGELLHARDIDYNDCREQQIVCPACREPVLKVGSTYTKREYLRHYPAKGHPGCELRVFGIIRDALHPVIVMPQGQELERFLSRFEGIVIEHSGPVAIPMLPLLHEMRVRRSFRELAFASRNAHRVACCHGVHGGTPIIDSLGMGTEIQESVRNMVLYLTSSNTFAAYLFAMAYGLTLFYTSAHAPSLVRSRDEDDDEHRCRYPELVELKDKHLRWWFNTLDRETKTWVGLEMAMALCEAACQFTMAVSEMRSGNLEGA